MKNIFALFLFTCLVNSFSFAGGCTGDEVPCADALPFCTDQTYDFPNSTSNCPPSGPNYGCLTDQPNPVWYYMQVGTAGTFQISLSQTTGPNGTGSGLDVDFAMWGPYSSVSAACDAVMTGNVAPIQCSYNIAPTETLGLGLPGGDPGAGGSTPPIPAVGDFYLVMITNYDGGSGYIQFNQTGGSGSTNCNVLNPQCIISELTAVPQNCSAGGQYDLTGTITFADAPATGELVVTNSCGGSQTFQAPFTSPLNYTIAGLTADGSSCTVTAQFSADLACTATADYVASTLITPTFNAISDLCLNSPAPTLPNTSNNGIIGTWSSSVNTSILGTSTYTFTPNSGQCATNATLDVTITNQPTPTFTPLTSVCQNAPAPSIPTTSNEGFTGVWTPAVTTSNAGTSTYTFTPDAGQCASSTTIQLTVFALPTINAGLDQTICLNQQVTLLAAGATSYTWDNGVVNGQVFTPSSTTTYTVTGTDGNTCQNTDQVTVTVNPLPIVNAGTDVTVCSGEPVTLNASGATTYSWNNGVTNATPFNPTTTTTYIVVGTDANNCQNTDQVLVTVNALPNINAGADQAVCIGESVTLTASGGSNYAWTNGVTNGTAFTPTATATYTVTGTGANGCTNTDNVVVTVNPLPTINAGADQTICEGMNVTLNATGGATYVWSNGTTNGQSISPGTTTTLTVTGTTAAGCSSTDEITITVLPVPNASFTADAVTGYPVHTVTFTNNSTNATSYTWDFGNGTILPATTTASQTQSYTDTAVYTVILYASNGICSDSTSIQIFVLPFPDAIIEVPNVFTPNADGLNDNWWIKAQFASSMSVQIFNRWGNLMKEIDGLYDPLDNNTYWNGQVDGTDATDGVYFYKFVIKDLNNKEYTGHGNITLVRKK